MIETAKYLFRIEKNLKRRGRGRIRRSWYIGKVGQRNTTVGFRITSWWLYNKHDQDSDFYVTLPSNASSNLFLL